MRSFLPNLLTLCNLFCGCLALVFILSERPFPALFCLGLALIFDLLDGLIARALMQANELGKQLDSLADVVSFGVVPGAMYYQLLGHLQISENLPFIAFAGFLFPLFGALRLARFNIEHLQKTHFTGLPIPSAALFVAGLYLIAHSTSCTQCASMFINPYVVLFSLLLLCWLMVSNLPHFSFKMKKISWQGHQVQWIYLFLVLVCVLFLREASVSLAIVLYIFCSLVYYSFAPNTRV